jgi:hypothetical protein
MRAAVQGLRSEALIRTVCGFFKSIPVGRAVLRRMIAGLALRLC